MIRILHWGVEPQHWWRHGVAVVFGRERGVVVLHPVKMLLNVVVVVDGGGGSVLLRIILDSVRQLHEGFVVVLILFYFILFYFTHPHFNPSPLPFQLVPKHRLYPICPLFPLSLPPPPQKKQHNFN